MLFDGRRFVDGFAETKMNIDVCKNCIKMKSPHIKKRCGLWFELAAHRPPEFGLMRNVLFVGVGEDSDLFCFCNTTCVNRSGKVGGARLSEDDLMLVEVESGSCLHYADHLMFDLSEK